MSCLFCDLASNCDARRNPEDQLIAESPSFYVKPALGQFAAGYVLINSRRHVRSSAFLTEEELTELDGVTHTIAQRLGKIYRSKIIIFEHGEVNSERHPGCCFEHAHLHIVPIPEDASDDLHLDFKRTTIQGFSQLSRLAQEEVSYLLYSPGDGCRYVYEVPEHLPSQFIRRKICLNLGLAEEWDWAVFPYRDRIEEFLRTYQAFARSNGWEYTLVTNI